MADASIRSGLYRSVLVIGAETYSRIIDPEDRDTAVIFGDGAGAVLYRRGDAAEPGAVHGVELGSDGDGADLVAIAAGGSRLPNVFPDMPRDLRFFRMNGREVFRLAIRRMTASADAVLGRVGWSADELDCFIGHQANQRILDAVADRLGVPAERRFGNIREVGNTAAASVPLALAHAVAAHAARPGGRALLTAFGGGLTWGSIALTWPDARPVELPPDPGPRSPSSRPPASNTWRSRVRRHRSRGSLRACQHPVEQPVRRRPRRHRAEREPGGSGDRLARRRRTARHRAGTHAGRAEMEMADLQLTVGELADRISGAVTAAPTAPEDSA